MPPEQFDRVLQTIPNLHIRKWKDEDIVMLFKILYHCALRIGEGLRLKVEDFELNDREIYLGLTKSNKEDLAVIPPDFMPELAVYLVNKTGPLFPGLTYGTVIKWIDRLGVMLDIPAWLSSQDATGEKTKTHIFRKSIGKDMLYGNLGTKAPLNVISAHLRHKGRSPLEMTAKYLKVESEDVKEWFSNQEVKDDDIDLL